MNEPPESPCKEICHLDTHFGWCAGCFRKPSEIREWRDADDDRKRKILAELGVREKVAAAKNP
ncbi:MAG: DUF1289 domain-containing protein [Planctomycetes bacterium]|nr:DUF1289 domain-containing protein [Planctomycetota bacterium]